MAVAMETRGDHSTGVCGVVDVKAQIVKTMDRASDFINLKEYQGLIEQSPSIVIGHTRFATIGAISDGNAHPFKIGRIIGCHNGHVNKYKEHFKKAEVDSEAIFYLLDKNTNDYKKTFEKLSGNITATWLDVLHPNRVYLVSHQNPLCLVRVPELNTIFWLSELDFLKSLIEATVGIKDKKFIDLYMDKENEVFKISDSLIIKTEKVEFAYGFASYSVADDYSYGTDSETLKLIKKDELIGISQDLETNFPSLEGKQEFCKIVAQRQCGYCQKKMKIDSGFWFDYENQGIVCDLCTQEDNLPTDTLGWVTYNQYYNLLLVTYDDKKVRLVQ